VVRGGYDIIYSNGISAAFGDQNGGISGPAYANYFAYNGDFSGQRPAFQFSKGAPNLNLPPLNQVKQQDNQFLGTGPQGFLRGSHDPYVEQWSLYVQRELPKNMGLSVGYVGTHGLHLYGDEFRSYDYVPTAIRQQLRTQINNRADSGGAGSHLWCNHFAGEPGPPVSAIHQLEHQFQSGRLQPVQFAADEI
jgi:hypothetical protein